MPVDSLQKQECRGWSRLTLGARCVVWPDSPLMKAREIDNSQCSHTRRSVTGRSGAAASGKPAAARQLNYERID
jgi:hypothetical protein